MNIVARHTTPRSAQAFLDTAHALNAFVGEKTLRCYQLDILKAGSFTCTCPFTGTPCRPLAHYVLPGSGVLYYFKTTMPFIVMAASLKDGFPLLCAITSDNALWTGKPERTDLIALAQQLLNTTPAPMMNEALKPRITLGDPNFAHFMWNEFPALFEAIKHTRDFSINLRFDPLGVMQGFAHQARLPVTKMTAPAEGKGWSEHPAVCLGSSVCGTSAKATLMTLMNLPEQRRTKQRIWLSVRDQGRTMENQAAFLSALIAALYARNPKTEFLLDGFSAPMDVNRKIYDALRPKFAARIQGARKITAQLISDHSNARIKDMTGRSLNTALHAISTCDFYVCHAGTMQHKPAWFYPLHGLQHGNHASLSPGALRWPAQMVAETHAPSGLPTNLVQDTYVSGLPVQNDRNRDYIITDVPAAVQGVLDQIDVNSSRQSAE
jgi:hypothetical protein